MVRIITAFALFIVTIAMFNHPAQAQDDKFVKITKPFANVYEYLDPKSAVVTMGKKGDHFKLVFAGDAWFQVQVNEKVGWLSSTDAEISSAPQLMLFNSISLPTLIIFILLLLGTLIGITIFINKHKTAEL
jgi:hypothetical protein